MKKNKISAAEFLAELHSDPEWARQHEEREARHKAEVAQLQAELKPEESPLLAELAEAGCIVNSISELVNTSGSYPEAVPVLTNYLSVARHPVLREMIARALTVREARGVAGRQIVDEVMSQKDAPGSEQRWALANALTVAADISLVDDIRELLADPRFEDVHERLKSTLKNLRAD
jgi:hypothetical protein